VDNLAILKPVYEAWAIGDYSKGGDIYDPGVVLSLSPDFPDIGIEPGFDGLLERMRYWIGAWERPLIVHADEFITLGDELVIVIGWWRGTSKSSGHVVQRSAAHLWKMRDGKAVKLMLCRDEAEAREFAAGF
jgi:ketosteroid isomerase-like protein